MEKVQFVNESVDNDTKGKSVISLRPFVSPGKVATPIFEVLARPTRSIVDEASSILNFLDGSLPSTYRGKTQVSVGLDAGEIFDKSFPEDFLGRIRLQNIEPSRIWLEICESAVLHETAWQRVIPELAGCGFRVVVKRYFADSSGFEVLASPHVSGIKVAPPVVAELPGSVLARRFFKGLQSLANAVNKQLIIDGVETLAQALWLEAMGCEILQGGYYGSAMGAGKARHFVLERRQQVALTVLNRL